VRGEQCTLLLSPHSDDEERTETSMDDDQRYDGGEVIVCYSSRCLWPPCAVQPAVVVSDNTVDRSALAQSGA